MVTSHNSKRRTPMHSMRSALGFLLIASAAFIISGCAMLEDVKEAVRNQPMQSIGGPLDACEHLYKIRGVSESYLTCLQRYIAEHTSSDRAFELYLAPAFPECKHIIHAKRAERFTYANCQVRESAKEGAKQFAVFRKNLDRNPKGMSAPGNTRKPRKNKR